jgi:hypothetical protein
MILDQTRQPEFAGLEYLSIYSKPNIAARRPSPNRANERTIDFDAVGSIGASNPKAAASRHRLLHATQDFAVIQAPDAVLHVTRGDTIEGLGRVATIESRNADWIVVMENGLVIDNRVAASSAIVGPAAER